jgi:hypothetical protein
MLAAMDYLRRRKSGSLATLVLTGTIHDSDLSAAVLLHLCHCSLILRFSVDSEDM